MVRRHSVALLVAILAVSAAQPAEAYIDPGNTSMLVQLVVGGVAAALVLSRRLFNGTAERVTRLFRSVSPDPSGPASRRRPDR